MPGIVRPVTHTGITADLVRKSKRRTATTANSAASYLSSYKTGVSAAPFYSTVVFDTIGASVGSDLTLDTSTGIVTVNADGAYSFTAQAQFPLANAGDELQVYVVHAAPWAGYTNAQVEATGTYQKIVEAHAPTTWYSVGDTFEVKVAYGPTGLATLTYVAFIAAKIA